MALAPSFDFEGGTVEVDQLPVDTTLLERVGPFESFCNHIVDMMHSLLHTFSTIARFIAVAQFEGLMCPGRCARRNSGTASNTRIKHYIDFDRGVTS